MKLLKLYSWFAGSQASFTEPFQNNDTQYDQAISFWNRLEGVSVVIVIIFVLLGICLSCFYYTSYNKAPGRHYTPKCWLLMLLTTVLLTFGLTYIFELIAVTPKLTGASMLEFKIALLNSLYAGALYFVVSLLWCNWFCKWYPTNAYMFLKLKKK